MQPVKNQKQVEAWLEKSRARQCFDTPGLAFQACRYQRGETITSPDEPFFKVMFLVEGTVQIYGIRGDGGLSPVGLSRAPMLLGDIEFITGGASPFYTEAKTDAACVYLSTRQYGEALRRDARLLHTLLESCANKLKSFSTLASATATVEERLLLYVESQPQGELRGVEAATLQLRCSRRQLHRVLKKLCLEGRLRRVGAGRYRLAENRNLL